MSNGKEVTIKVVNGPTIAISWSAGMNAQQALELAYDKTGNVHQFTYALQYFGKYGYLVVMINDTFETFDPTTAPNYYWEFFVNGKPASAGIDSTVLNAGDEISFELQSYSPGTSGKTVDVKYQSRMR